MKKYYITDGMLHYENSRFCKDEGICFEVADDQTELVIPKGVIEIMHSCFAGNKMLQKITLPEGLQKISGWAFRGCSALRQIMIPEGVRLIGDRLFNHCTALEKVILPSTLIDISYNVFEGCTALREVVITEGVSRIAEGAFQQCSALERIVIPSSAANIGRNAFKGCTALREVVLCGGKTGVICNNAFEDCTALQELILPRSIWYVMWEAFKNCKNLRRIEMKGVRTLGGSAAGSAFEGCGKLEEIVLSPELALQHYMHKGIPCRNDDKSGMKLSMDGRILMGICEEDATRQSKITEITIPEGVTHIAADILGFKGKHNVEKIILPESLQSIGDGAFKEHPFKEIVLPAGVRVVGRSAFYRCRELEKVVLNDGLRIIGKGAFAECEKLREIVIPASVEQIDATAFENCENLEKITISDGLRVIGTNAFKGCTKLPCHILPDSIGGILDWSDEPYEFAASGKVDAEPAKNKKLSGLIPFFSVKTIAQLIVHQKGKAIVEEISRGLGENIAKVDLSAVAKAICEEISSLKKKAFDTATAFYTDYAEQMTAEDIRSFIAVLESKKALKNIDTLQANAEIQKKINEECDAPAAEQHPMESSLGERAEKVFAKESIATLRKAARDLRAKGQIPDGIIYADGTPVSDAAFAFMLCACEGRLSVLDTPRELRAGGWQEVLPLVDALDQSAFHAAMHQMFDQKMYEKNAWLVAMMCVFGDEKLLAKITPMKNKWADWHTWGTTGKELSRWIDHWALYSPTREALVFADKNNHLAWYAQIHGTTESALRSRLLADFGFDEKGVRVFRAGDAEIEASLNPDASVQLLNRKTGKTAKTFPKKGEPNDGEAFAAWKKQLSTVVKSRVKALKDELAQGRKRPLADWQEENCTNPIYAALAKGVVWGVYDEDGAYRLSFRLNDEMQKVDVCGANVEIGENMRISVLHPVDCEWEEIKAWKEAFSLIAQPIEQMDVPVRLPDVQTLISRYEGCMVNVGKLLHGMNGTQDEGTVTGGNDTVQVMIMNGYDYWGEYPVEEVSINPKTFADKRKYSTDILQMDNLLNPFAKAQAAIDEKDLEKVRGMVDRGLIIRDNIRDMIERAADAGAVEISLYLIELSRQWGMAEDEDDLSL